MSGYRENAKLTAYALEELGVRESKGVEREVARSEAAKEAAEEILEVAALLRDEFDAEPGLFLTAEQRAAILRGEASGAERVVAGDEEPGRGDWSVEEEIGAGQEEVVAKPVRVIATGGRGWFLAGVATAAAAMLMVALWQVATPARSGTVASATSEGMEVTIGVLEEIRPGAEILVGGEREAEEEESVLWPEVGVIEEVEIDYDVPGELFSDGFASWSPKEFSRGVHPHEVARAMVSEERVDVSELVSGAPVELVAMPRNAEPSAFAAPPGSGVFELGGYWLDHADLIPSSGVGAVVDGGADRLISEGAFLPVLGAPLSAIPLSYDPAGYANLRHFLMEYNMLPPKRLVSLGDLVNYFDYGYAPPLKSGGDAVRTSIEVADCPWAPERLLVRVGIKAKSASEMHGGRNVALLVDSSATMMGSTKLPVIEESVEAMLTGLGESGQVAVIPYGGPFGFHLDPTSAVNSRPVIGTIMALASGIGDAEVGRSLDEAVLKAREVYSGKGGVDQVVVVTDSLLPRRSGDRSVPAALMPLKRMSGGVAVIGMGTGILEESELLSEVVDAFEFHHAGTVVAGRRAFERVGRAGSEVMVAKHVTADVEFNPQSVRAYRLLAGVGEMQAGAASPNLRSGQEITALYEVLPSGGKPVLLASEAQSLKYDHLVQEVRELSSGAGNRKFLDELMTVRISYQRPVETGVSKRKVIEESVAGGEKRSLEETTADFRFAAAVAGYGMLVGGYRNTGDLAFEDLVDLASDSVDAENDQLGMRREFLELMQATLGMLSR